MKSEREASLVIRRGVKDGSALSWQGVDLQRELPVIGVKVEMLPMSFVTVEVHLETAVDIDIEVDVEWYCAVVHPRNDDYSVSILPIVGFAGGEGAKILPLFGCLAMPAPAGHSPRTADIDSILFDGTPLLRRVKSIELHVLNYNRSKAKITVYANKNETPIVKAREGMA